MSVRSPTVREGNAPSLALPDGRVCDTQSLDDYKEMSRPHNEVSTTRVSGWVRAFNVDVMSSTLCLWLGPTRSRRWY